jgi:hypothetical protein
MRGERDVKEIHITIILATLAAALLQFLAQPPKAQAGSKLACSCAPATVPS